MLKRDEMAGSPGSCLGKAKDDELIFVLLARDRAAADTVRYWAHRRVQLGLNSDDDAKIVSAMQWADEVDKCRTH